MPTDMMPLNKPPIADSEAPLEGEVLDPVGKAKAVTVHKTKPKRPRYDER
jgi:hypothetical protein